MPKKPIVSAEVPTSPIFSQAMDCSGRTIYVSGVVARDKNDEIVGVDDPKAQTKQIFENMKAVLAAANATLDDVVKLNIFLTDIKYNSAVREVRGQYFKSPAPASTLVAVSSLIDPRLLVEIEAVAVL